MAFVSKLLACAGMVAAGVAGSSVDDSMAMVQASAEASSAVSREALSRSVAGRTMGVMRHLDPNAAALPQLPKLHFNCTEHPKFCEKPFECHTYTMQEHAVAFFRGVAPEGHGNPRSFCLSADYEDYMHTCIVKKDLVKAAHIQYEWSIKKGREDGPMKGVDELDASYCFIEGHCTNAAVTNETTLEEADRMCDERYGDDWRHFGSWQHLDELNLGAMQDPAGLSRTSGFYNTRITSMFLKMACAMGNYHCDVMYCKETYCKNPYYVKRYGHRLPRVPGHLLQQRTKV